jgi:hypothetical protein
VVVEGCGSDSLQGDVRFAKVMEMLGAKVEWSPYSIKITGPKAFGKPIQVRVGSGADIMVQHDARLSLRHHA